MKLLLALLAIFTGLSLTDGVRIAEPAIAEGDGAVRGGWTSDDVRPSVAIAAVLLIAAVVPLVLSSLPATRWTTGQARRAVTATVHRCDRMLQ